MNRCLLVSTLGLALAGCAQGRSGLPGGRSSPGLEPVGIAPIDNIHETINRTGLAREDPSTRRASAGDPSTAKPASPNEPAPLPAGRPAPFANQATRGPRPQSPIPPVSDPAQSPKVDEKIEPSITDRPTAATTPDTGLPATPKLDELTPDVVPPNLDAEKAVPEASKSDPEAGKPAGDAPQTQTAPEPSNQPEIPSLEESPAQPDTPKAKAAEDLPKDLPSLPDPPGSAQGRNPQASPAPGPTASAIPAVDPEVLRTAATDTDPTQARIPTKELDPISQIAARVGDDSITFEELRNSVHERLLDLKPEKRPRNADHITQFAKATLDDLIIRTLLIQEAKRKIKNPKNWEMFTGQVEKVWKEHELPTLLTKYNVADEAELKKYYEDHKLNIQDIHESFKNDTIANEFRRMEILPKVRVDHPEMLSYYEAHKGEYDRPASVTWSEVVVDFSKHKSKAEARRIAEKLLDRLRHGEDFARIARGESDGSNARKAGLWEETSPGSNVVEVINQTLDSLPANTVSPILEGPTSFHIVRVESRRQAGPASFAEVQSDILEKLREQKFREKVRVFVKKLHERTVIYSPAFEGTKTAPSFTNINMQLDNAPAR